MKINLPVTNNEVLFEDTEFMVTRTDLKGIITHVNQDFIKISGFSESELIGKSHNVVRHPDMPEEAFKDLWANLKEGKPWEGLVKNRCKNGDFYWVNANVTPFSENGKLAGYVSVRRKPARESVIETSKAYQLFKDGKADGLIIKDGKVVRQSLGNKLYDFISNINVATRLYGIISLGVILACALTGLGLLGLSKANDSLDYVYHGCMEHAAKLTSISKSMLNIEAQLFNIAGETQVVNGPGGKKSIVLNKEVANEVVPVIDKEVANISNVWKNYLAGDMLQDEKDLAKKVGDSRERFLINGVNPAQIAIRNLNAEETMRYADKMPELYQAADKELQSLIDYQYKVANQEYKRSLDQYKLTRLVSFAALGSAIVVLFWLGLIVIKAITRPLKRSIEIFEDISRGKLDSSIKVHGNNELSRVLFGLKSMQTNFGADLKAQQDLGEKIKDQSVRFEGQLAAINKSTGMIEFDIDGKILDANDLFLKAVGYSLNDILGKNHSIFVEGAYAASPEYRKLWEMLNEGKAVTGQFKRYGNDGKEIWLEASYNPILDRNGKPYKVVKYATDITENKIRNADFESQIEAIGKTQGVIELGLDGKVLKANEVYLNMLGYKEEELIGQHVSIVLDPNFARSEAYKTLWDRLVAGGSDAGQYKRIAKDGREVWIQASYNPIRDINGKTCKIVNFTIDITQQKLIATDNASQLSAINKIQGVIEFDLNGVILNVNDNFAKVTGYSKDEIVGNHHSMFVESSYRSSPEYKSFWEQLGRGEAQSAQYKRIGKDGREIWLQASYNPILDLNGKAYKVIKYATDITQQITASKALASAVKETQEVVSSAKAGDLTLRIPIEGKTGEIMNLCEGVNSLVENMATIIKQIKEAGETITTAANEISMGNSDLSSRTETQASSLEETASSMEELASTVKQNAENAKQANVMASAASNIAEKGGTVVSQVVETMSEISNSSKKIEDIISVIDGIAFQTNILALNAAVEAARAGEQGRGFAVVAGEVRNLAQRSASAAKEINQLISDSLQKVDIGTKLVQQAGETMFEIVTSVKRVTDIMGEITAASVEQSSGIDQVNNAITQMDEVTQQNAALVEESAAAAESMVDQANQLMEKVTLFKVDEKDQAGAKVPRVSQNRQVKPSNEKFVPKPLASRPQPSYKTGTDDGDWEEF